MRIGYDASSVRQPLSGVGNYASSLLDALLSGFPDSRFLLLSHQAGYSKAEANLMLTQTRGFPVKEIWMQLLLPRILERFRPDVCHFTNGITPLRVGVPYVVTIHDLSLIRHPEWHPLSRRIWMRRLVRPSLEKASRLICDSETVRDDLLQWLGIDPSRVHVVPLAARRVFFGSCSETKRAEVLARYGLSRPFVLYVGNIEPRKNLSRLLAAFSRLNPAGVDIVLAGRLAWLWRDTVRDIRRLQGRGAMHLLGYVPEEDLPALYQSALAFAYPSLLEGFGLPVLEAMASGVPVLASRIGPLISLVEDAGWLVSPEDVGEWHAALVEAIGDGDKRLALAARARERARLYNWDRTAEETMKCYEEALSSSAAGWVGDRGRALVG
jgi:glycosyltransferase involved in cell wall biosynthesis